MSEPQPSLARFNILVMKNKSGMDAAQVPADSTVEFYGQGTTVRSEPPQQPVSGSATIQVWHLGEVLVGDKLWRNGKKDATPNSNYPEMVVTSIASSDPNDLSITVSFTSTLSWAKYDRLILAIPATGHPSRPSAYSSPLGLGTPIGTSIQTFANQGGIAGCYLLASRFDYVVNVTGEALRVFPDAAGSFVMRS